MTELKITGMTCGHCQSAVEGALKGVAGVEEVRVDLAQGTAEVKGSANVAALVAAVEEEGYQASAAKSAQGG
jgi:copper chaperone